MTDLPQRIVSVSNKLDELEIDAMLVTNEINVRYLSGFTGDSSYLLVRRGKAMILSDGRYETQIAEQCPSLAAAIRPPGQLMPDLLRSVAGDLGDQRIGIEACHVSVAALGQMQADCRNVRWVETTDVVERLRMIKDASEIAITRQAVEIAESCFRSMVGELDTRWTERAIAHELESKMRALGAEGVSFPPIVAAGPSGALPHYHPNDTVIGEAATLLIDWGACYCGYASDLTRTLHRDHASDRFRRAYQVVLEAQIAAIEAIGPGVAACEVDAAARRVLAREGMDEAFKHGLGHGTGLQIHEAPRMSSVSEETLASGMIITVEPGVYFEGDFGIRIEDDILVTDRGREVLSCLPKGLEDCRWML
jgi:Xaa-Pro aminopeptidase